MGDVSASGVGVWALPSIGVEVGRATVPAFGFDVAGIVGVDTIPVLDVRVGTTVGVDVGDTVGVDVDDGVGVCVSVGVGEGELPVWAVGDGVGDGGSVVNPLLSQADSTATDTTATMDCQVRQAPFTESIIREREHP